MRSSSDFQGIRGIIHKNLGHVIQWFGLVNCWLTFDFKSLHCIKLTLHRPRISISCWFINDVQFCHRFYPRPVLAFGYCRCLCLCVCVSVCLCVCQSLACPRDNSGPVQARIAKFGPKMQKTLVKVPIVLGGNWPWPSRSNLTSKSEFTQFWAWPDHNSLPIHARITKFGPEVENSLVKVPIVLGGNWPRPSRSNLILTVEFFYQTYLRCFFVNI